MLRVVWGSHCLTCSTEGCTKRCLGKPETNFDAERPRVCPWTHTHTAAALARVSVTGTHRAKGAEYAFPSSTIPRIASFLFFFFLFPCMSSSPRYDGTRANCITVCRQCRSVWITGWAVGRTCTPRAPKTPEWGSCSSWGWVRPHRPLGPCSEQEAKDNFPRLQHRCHWRAGVTYV